MLTDIKPINRTGEGELRARLEAMQRHAAPLQFKGAPRDTVVRITRYKNGAVVEIIEKRVSDERVKGRKRKAKGKRAIQNFPSKTARRMHAERTAARKARAAATLGAAERTAGEDV